MINRTIKLFRLILKSGVAYIFKRHEMTSTY